MATNTPAVTQPSHGRHRDGPISAPYALSSGWPIVLSVLILAVGVRLWGIRADLPFMHHPDEPFNIGVADAMVRAGDPNPHFFNYPSLWIYLMAALHLDGPLLGWIPNASGSTPVSQVIGVSYAPAAGQVLLDRVASVVADTATVALVWASTRRLTRGLLPAVGGAALVAFSPIMVENARFATPDALTAMLVAGTIWASLRVLERGTWPTYVLAGVLTGLAASTKYTAVIVAVAVAAAAASRGREALLRLPAAGLAAGAAFVLTTPYAVLDRAQFLAGLEFEREHYRNGHPGMDGDTIGFYLSLLARQELVLAVLALAGIALNLRRTRALLVVAAFPLVYGLVISQQSVRNDRTLMLLLPALAVLAAMALDSVPRPRVKAGITVISAVAAGAVLLPTLPDRSPSTWEQARSWLAANAAGRPVLIESYGPWLDPRPGVAYCVRAIDCPQPAGTYLVLAEQSYGRFTPAYPEAYAAYQTLFARPEVARFEGNGSLLRIVVAP